MTPRQRRFVEDYLIDLNATQAARRAGHGERSARTTGYQFPHKPTLTWGQYLTS